MKKDRLNVYFDPALSAELDTLAAQLEKDVATLKLKYAKRKQHLESVVRGKASYVAQGGGQ